MDWPRMCESLGRERHWLPEQVLDIPIVQFWLIFRLTVQTVPHSIQRIRDWWNQKFRLAKGLAPIAWKD